MEALGIDLTWFLFQLGNFTLLFVGLTWLLHRPLLNLIQSRRQEIQESLENASRIRDELASTREQQVAMLEETRKESTALLQETKERALKLEEQLKNDAKEKAERIAEQAQKEIENERTKLRAELKAELADLVIQTTQKVLGEHVSLGDKKSDVKAKIESLTK